MVVQDLEGTFSRRILPRFTDRSVQPVDIESWRTEHIDGTESVVAPVLGGVNLVALEAVGLTGADGNRLAGVEDERHFTLVDESNLLVVVAVLWDSCAGFHPQVLDAHLLAGRELSEVDARFHFDFIERIVLNDIHSHPS